VGQASIPEHFPPDLTRGYSSGVTPSEDLKERKSSSPVNEMTITEKRRFSRAPFQMEIRVIADDRIVVSNHLRDISLGGAYIVVDRPLPEGMPCILSIDLIGPRSLLRVEIEGEVVRVENEGMAVKFTRIDVDSLVHLRHLIRVHAQDPETIDCEFESNFLDKEDSC
jgi:hypothetical protein